MRSASFFVISLVLGSAPCGLAAEIDFNRDIRPILSNNCYKCHGPDGNARQADLRLDTKDGLLDEAIVSPGEPESSELLRRVTSEDVDEHMPPPDSKLQLNQAQIQKLQQWIAAGAPWSGHWSLERPVRPTLPTVSDVQWPNNAIDYFVLSRIERENLLPNRQAEKARLIRRVTLDLTGLPPTPAEVDAFVADTLPDAYQRLIQRLLSSPRYGERMAWDWLDAARYADSNGFQGDRERTMWPWRDWVVGALNRNLPYDDFTVWQLAGDLREQTTPEQRLATGFCRNHMINGEGGRIAEENRIEYIFDQIETVGTVWLGLTVQCCRCHDHKFDPLSQQEYYQLFAFFNQTPVNGGGGDPQTAPVMEAPSRRQSRQLAELQAGLSNAIDEVQKIESRWCADGVDGTASESELPEKVKTALTKKPSERNSNELAELEKHFQENTRYASLLKRNRELLEQRSRLQSSVPRVMVMQDVASEKRRKTFILEKGLYNQPRGEVHANTPAALRSLPKEASRDRLALAQWLVDPSHPLVARVTVNRIWQSFFGNGLVKTVDDFGSQGRKPSHPQLLDWLATELVQSDWDIKHIVRLIVQSATYRQSAKTDARRIQLDPENRLLTRGPRRRMPSWMIRDQALAVSGLLVERNSGPPVKAYQPPGVWAEATFGNKKYTPDKGQNLYRRSLYVFWRRIVGPTMFFDVAKRQTCSVKTSQTNSPLHALVTLNDTTYVEAARHLAECALFQAATPERLDAVFRLVVARAPSTQETQLLTARVDQLTQHYAANLDEAKALLSVGESARHEQLDLAEHAAWTGICLLILNLDESLNN